MGGESKMEIKLSKDLAVRVENLHPRLRKLLEADLQTAIDNRVKVFEKCRSNEN